jgi:hypothetical protein
MRTWVKGANLHNLVRSLQESESGFDGSEWGGVTAFFTLMNAVTEAMNMDTDESGGANDAEADVGELDEGQSKSDEDLSNLYTDLTGADSNSDMSDSDVE